MEEVAAAVEAGARLWAAGKQAAGPVAVLAAAVAQPPAVARAEGDAGSWLAGRAVQCGPPAGWASPGLRWAGRAGWPRCAAAEAGPALRRRWRSPHAGRPQLHRAYLQIKKISENKKLDGNMS